MFFKNTAHIYATVPATALARANMLLCYLGNATFQCDQREFYHMLHKRMNRLES